jgi:Imidazolonepropionase and related amidohydrolases
MEMIERPPALVLRGVHVLDQSGGFSGPLDVAARHGRIDAVGPGLPRRADAREIDAAGLWLLPGVFDCHVHVDHSTFDADELAATPALQRASETTQALRHTLHAGVTTLRDAGGAPESVRRAAAHGSLCAPRLQLCVAGLRAPVDGSGVFVAGAERMSSDGDVSDAVESPPGAMRPDDMRRAVRELVARGADWIKLMATPGVLSGTDPCLPLFSDDMIGVAADEAARRDRRMMVHAHGGPALRAAVLAGAHSIEHALFLTEDDAELMARHHCTLVPTLAIYHELAAPAAASRLGAAVEMAADQLPRLGEAVRVARAAGVRIALGSDFAHRDQHGHNLVELVHLRRAGLSPEEALLAGTANAASLCGVDDHLGRIAAGCAFDALLLDADPGDLSCFERTDAATGVFLGGVPVLPHPRLADAR